MAARDYYLIKRRERLTDGKPTWYCRFRALEGNLLPWRSTGLTAKTAAESFERYAEEWWTEGHSYVQGRLARGSKLTATYLVVMRGHLQNHLLPSFKDKYIAQITPRQVEEWVLSLRRRKLSPSTINHALRCLKIMLKEATRHGIIPRDPSAFITGLAEHPAERGILTGAEIRALFDEKQFEEVWEGDRKHFTLNLMAASTGIRMGEDWTQAGDQDRRRTGSASPEENFRAACRSYRILTIPGAAGSRFLRRGPIHPTFATNDPRRALWGA
jgi:hypothetical protein